MCLIFINSPIILKPGLQEYLRERQRAKTGIPGFYLCSPDMLLSTQESGMDYFTSNLHRWFLVLSLNSCKPPTSLPHMTLCQWYPCYYVIHKSTFPHQSWKTFLLCLSLWKCSCAHSLLHTAKLAKVGSSTWSHTSDLFLSLPFP